MYAKTILSHDGCWGVIYMFNVTKYYMLHKNSKRILQQGVSLSNKNQDPKNLIV